MGLKLNKGRTCLRAGVVVVLDRCPYFHSSPAFKICTVTNTDGPDCTDFKGYRTCELYKRKEKENEIKTHGAG